MKKICVIILIILFFATGCRQSTNSSNTNDKTLNTDNLFDELNIIEHQALNLMSLNNNNNNMLYLKGWLNGNNTDVKLLDEYFNKNISRIHLISKTDNEVEIKDFEWNFAQEDEKTTFNLLLFTKDKTLVPQVYSQVRIVSNSIEKEFSIGNYQVYSEETSPDETIITIYSPFAFSNNPPFGEPFKISYDVAVNPKRKSDNIKFFIDLPESYKTLEIQDISYSYNESRTREYMAASPGIVKKPDDYKNLRVYNVTITYKQLIKGNIQIQPLIRVETEHEKFICKPITPFNILY